MGKIRRARLTYHLQAAQNVDVCQESASLINSKQQPEGRLEELQKIILPLGNPDAAMFKNLKIDIKDLVHHLPEPKQSVSLQHKPSQPLPKMYKKDKMRLRHATFLAKIEAIVNAGKEAIATKIRQKTAVIGDIRPLTAALPKINSPKPSDKRASTSKLHPVKKFKARRKQMMEDILAFKQVRSHPSFQRDPEGTIMDHLHNKLKEELT